MKTTTASKFPNSIIVPFENGIKGAVANVLDGMEDWNDFIDFVDDLEENRIDIGDNVQTIVFDTINAAYEMMESYVLKYCGRKDGTVYRDVSDMQAAKNASNFWIERDKVLKIQIDRILGMGFSILFLTHLKVKTIKPKKGDSYDVYVSTMPARLADLIYPLVDFILTGERREVQNEDGTTTKKRVLLTKGNSMSTSGNRVFIDDDIVFDTEEEAMEKYQEAFKKSVIKKIEEAGIKDDFETISEKQKKEKDKKVEKYVAENSLNKDDLYKEFQVTVKDLKDKSILKAKLDDMKIAVKDVKNLDVKDLKKLLDSIK